MENQDSSNPLPETRATSDKNATSGRKDQETLKPLPSSGESLAAASAGKPAAAAPEFAKSKAGSKRDTTGKGKIIQSDAGMVQAIPVAAEPKATVEPMIPKAVVVAEPTPSLNSSTVQLPGDSELAEGQQTPVDEVDVHTLGKRRALWTAVPSWLFSLLVHLALILILAAVTLEPVRSVMSVLQASTSTAETAIEQFDLQGPSLDASSDSDPLLAEAPTVDEAVTLPEVTSSVISAVDSSSLESLDVNAITESILPSSLLSSSALAQMSTALSSRSAAARGEMLERFGGTAASEKAVALGLKWIAAHQAKDGGWNFMHVGICRNPSCTNPGDMDLARNGATAMAILPFLGAGQTHVEGEYRQTVYRGLEFLINRMQVSASPTLPVGSWHEPGGRMYSHALAAITVCEAYAMTKDPDLLQPAQLSLNYLIQAQNQRDGGWRYNPGDRGDTSVVGWCLMALKSGKMGNLIVPPRTFQGADQFLDFVSTNNGAYYGYNKPTSNLDGRQATIAVGLLCRMYLGYPKEHPGLQEGIEYLSNQGPKLNDLYYSYYATQVMRHHGGEVWETWNRKMRDQLVQAQVSDGHAAGSWYQSGGHAKSGGRLYNTSLATMILEVYYRHMPLYSERSSADDFEL